MRAQTTAPEGRASFEMELRRGADLRFPGGPKFLVGRTTLADETIHRLIGERPWPMFEQPILPGRSLFGDLRQTRSPVDAVRATPKPGRF